MAKRKTKTPKVPASLPPVQQGLISPKRNVPGTIARPPYALSGYPGPSILPLTRTSSEIKSMGKAGAIAAEVLLHVGEKVTAGISTDKLDEIAHDEIIRQGAYPSPLNYRGFRKSICTSVNEVVCHGIPSDRVLRDVDAINVDITAIVDEYYGDTSIQPKDKGLPGFVPNVGINLGLPLFPVEGDEQFANAYPFPIFSAAC